MDMRKQVDKVIIVEDTELGRKRAKKEAAEAELRGLKVGYDLTNINDKTRVREIIKEISGISNRDEE